MQITDKNLEDFRSWMVERGRSDDSATTYIWNLKSCASDPKGITNRLVERKLSPNSLRTNLAALRAWASYTEDVKFAKRLGDIKLPPARRIRSKQPLSTDDWRRAIRHLQTCPMNNEAMRQTILIMALRGLRSGDVLRIQHGDVLKALATGKLAYEGKGRKRIEISAAPIKAQLKALALLDPPDWERVSDLISTSVKSKVASKKVWRAARRTAAKIGIDEMNPHRYRHTFATRFLDELKGDPNALVKLQKYMVWESLNTASRYVDAIDTDQLDQVGENLVSGLMSESAEPTVRRKRPR